MITPRSVCDFPQQKVSGEEKAKPKWYANS